jgi:membrane protein YdbS with pleckstrin-like domain
VSSHTSPAGANPALRDPAHQVSAKAPVLWTIGAAIPSLVLLVAVVVVDLVWFDVPWWVYPPLVVILVAYVAVMPRVRYRIHRWESTDTAVYTQTGWLSRERRIAPMSRVQTVDFEQGWIDRALGLATVTVTTASAAGPLQISAIDKPVADRLVDDLTRRTEAEAGDAT